MRHVTLFRFGLRYPTTPPPFPFFLFPRAPLSQPLCFCQQLHQTWHVRKSGNWPIRLYACLSAYVGPRRRYIDTHIIPYVTMSQRYRKQPLSSCFHVERMSGPTTPPTRLRPRMTMSTARPPEPRHFSACYWSLCESEVDRDPASATYTRQSTKIRRVAREHRNIAWFNLPPPTIHSQHY